MRSRIDICALFGKEKELADFLDKAVVTLPIPRLIENVLGYGSAVNSLTEKMEKYGTEAVLTKRDLDTMICLLTQFWLTSKDIFHKLDRVLDHCDDLPMIYENDEDDEEI